MESFRTPIRRMLSCYLRRLRQATSTATPLPGTSTALPPATAAHHARRADGALVHTGSEVMRDREMNILQIPWQQLKEELMSHDVTFSKAVVHDQLPAAAFHPVKHRKPLQQRLRNVVQGRVQGIERPHASAGSDGERWLQTRITIAVKTISADGGWMWGDVHKVVLAASWPGCSGGPPVRAMTKVLKVPLTNGDKDLSAWVDGREVRVGW